MTAKECRQVFNTMVKGLAERSETPETSDPSQLLITIQMHQLQALWEIAAQLATGNEHADAEKPKLHRVQ